MQTPQPISENQVRSWIEGMVWEGQRKLDIQQFLNSRKVPPSMIDKIMDEVFQEHYGEKFRKNRVWAVVLVAASILLFTAYFVAERQRQQRFQDLADVGKGVELADGRMLVTSWDDGREVWLRKLALGTTLLALTFCYRTYKNWNTYKVYKSI